MSTAAAPRSMPLENDFRQVQTNSVEYDALLSTGWTVVEQDGTTTILHRPSRRAADRSVTNGDVMRWRRLERAVLESLAAELSAANGAPITGEQLRWAMDEFRSRVMRESGGRAIVSGRMR